MNSPLTPDQLDRLIASACRTSEELGAAVFPVRVEPDPSDPNKSTKRPLVKGWQNGAAVSNPEAIETLFREHANAVTHAGIQTGRIVVIDLDGEQAQGWWRAHLEMLPMTRTVDTRRPGGKHLFYRVPAHVELRNSAGKIAPGVDFRGVGGFVVDWSAEHPPAVDDVADAPGTLIAFLQRASSIREQPTANARAEEGSIPPGGRNDFLSREAYRLRRQGATVEQILVVLRAINETRCRPPLGDAELRAIADGKERVAPEPASRERVIVQLPAGQLHVYADQAERLIADEVYVRGQQLARLGTAPELGRTMRSLIQRPQDQRVIVPVNGEFLRRRLNTLGEFQTFSRTAKEWRAVDCPRDLCTNILDVGDWQHFRPLEGLAMAPFMRADGTVCDTPGYDGASGVFYAPTATFPPIPKHPTKDDAAAALARMRAPFAQFPFDQGAEAAFLSHILAAVGRHAIDTMPVFFYTASMPASGKTLLAKMPSRLANGVEPGTSPYTDDAEELRKVLFSALLAGDTALLLDNVPSGVKVRSAVLCGFATAPVYSDRRLGASERPTLPNRCTVVMSGNNITPASDMARRSIVIRLVVDAETARGREFAIPDIRAYIGAHRAQLLVDALTVMLAFTQAAPPGMPKPLESFEQYSRIARDPLVWLGVGDAVETQQTETEDDIAPLREAFDLLARYPKFGGKEPFAARDLAAECDQMVAGAELKAAVEAAGCSDASNPIKVGYWLRAHRDRVAAGRKLVNSGPTHGCAKWLLRELPR